MAVSHRLFRLYSLAKNTPSSFLIRSLSSSSSSSHGPTLDPEIDLEEATAQLEKSSSSSPSPSNGRNFHWVFLGCPSVGKGIYASRLSTLLGVPHIATGDPVREELSSSGLLSSQVEAIVRATGQYPERIGEPSCQTEQVMETLRKLAHDGHTVICSIHQPRGSVYLDAFVGITVVNCGHCHPGVVEPVINQIKRLQHPTVLYLNHAIADFSEALASKLPSDLKVLPRAS